MEKKINYPQALTSAIQLQNRSYHVEERTRAAARAMRANLIVKIKKYICKFVKFSLTNISTT